jgi:hypothetical protein
MTTTLKTPPKTGWKTQRIWLAIGALLALAACSNPSSPAPAPKDPAPAVDPLDGVAASTKNELLWKRARAVESGLAQALAIPVEDVCNELDRYSCIGLVHQVPLGGNDPFAQGLYEPLRAPSTTTALSFDRVVLAACSAAVEIDAARPAPIVFRGHPLTDAPLTDAADAVIGADLLGTTLVRRVHGREPEAGELTALHELLVDDDGAPVSGRTFAKLACFAVASTTENLFY